MANRDFKTVQALNREVKILAGMLVATGASDPTVFDGIGFSVSRQSQGVYRVTPTDRYNGVLSFQIQVHSSAARLRIVQGGTISSNGYMEFRYIDETGAVQDIDSGDLITFSLIVRNSTVK